MQIITVASQKGGAGKTTIAVHLAVAAIKRGLKVRILDGDPQGSAVVWATVRKDNDLVRPVQPRQLADALQEAKKDRIGLVIIDAPPAAGPESADLIGLANLVLIPVRPSVFDLAAAQKTVNLVKLDQSAAMLVISAAPLRAPEIALARDALAGSGVPVAKTVIHDRRPFSRAIQTGRAVGEFEPEGKAAKEIDALLTEVLK
jgi:chromosome partitioning protein